MQYCIKYILIYSLYWLIFILNFKGNEGFGISEKMSPFVDKLITIESG